jgi:hypothetical protein
VTLASPLPAETRPAAPSGTPDLARDEVQRAVDRLVEECRVECLWYVRPDYLPSTDEERLAILDAIQQRSTREVFQRAGVLKTWLSRHCSDGSAAS